MAASHEQRTPDFQLLEDFTRFALAHCKDDCAVVHLRPWSELTDTPKGVVSPATADGVLDQVQLAKQMENKHTVLAGCSFLHEDEEVAACNILPQISAFSELCVIIVHVFAEGVALTRDSMEAFLRCHDRMLSAGIDDVVYLHRFDPVAFQHSLTLASSVWELNVRRMQLMLKAVCEDEPMHPRELHNLQERHRRLLWESIPRALMPHFKPVDRDLGETDTIIGKYAITKKVSTALGDMIYACYQDKSVTIKKLQKSAIFTPGELEGIYREYRFLSDVLSHHNVIKCLEMFHSESWLYLVFEDMGHESLQQLLLRQEGQKLQGNDLTNVFSQLMQALAYCHSMDTAHRNVTLDHVMTLYDSSIQEFHCKLCDFHTAMVAKKNTLSRTTCGVFPSMAPEMATGGPYVPTLADIWSAGIVLLEMAGGCGSLQACTNADFSSDPSIVASAIHTFFAKPNAHRMSLSCLGVSPVQNIVDIEAKLLQLRPADRSQLTHVFEH